MKKAQPINAQKLIAAAYKDKLVQSCLKLADKLFKKVPRKHYPLATKKRGNDYAAHPMTVMSILLELGIDDSHTLAAAALEDVLHLTAVKESTVLEVAGSEVMAMVATLARPKEGDDPAEYAQRLAAASPAIQNIKLASLLEDLCSIPSHKVQEEFAMFDQAEQLLAVLTKGEAELVRRVQLVIRASRS